jgi:hypothetical protein
VPSVQIEAKQANKLTRTILLCSLDFPTIVYLLRHDSLQFLCQTDQEPLLIPIVYVIGRNIIILHRFGQLSRGDHISANLSIKNARNKTTLPNQRRTEHGAHILISFASY